MALSVSTIELFDKINCKVHTSLHAEEYQRNDEGDIVTDDRGRPVVTKKERWVATVFDLATGQSFAKGEAKDEDQSAQNAYKNALSAAKPLTPLQAATKKQVDDAVAAKDREIEELRKRLEEATKITPRAGSSRQTQAVN